MEVSSIIVFILLLVSSRMAWDLFSPWGVYVAEEHKLNREDYKDEVD